MQAKNQNKTKKYKDFGMRLRALREGRGVTQKQLALSIGKNTQVQVSRIENGKSWPNGQMFLKIAETLDADLHWLITGDTPPGDAALVESYNKAVLRLVYWVQEYMNDLQQRSESLRGEIEPMKEMHDRGMEVDMDRLKRLKAAHDLLLEKYRAAVKTLDEVLGILDTGKEKTDN